MAEAAQGPAGGAGARPRAVQDLEAVDQALSGTQQAHTVQLVLHDQRLAAHDTQIATLGRQATP